VTQPSRDIYVDDVNINLTTITKLNFFRELDNQIEPKNNKETKMNQINKLGN